MGRRGRERDVVKERFWRDAIRRWGRSGQSIRGFCDGQGLSEVSFHAWRRTIAQRDQQVSRSSPTSEAADRLPAFVPVRVTSARVMPAVTTPSAASLELVVDRGRVIRVPPGFDVVTLRSLLAVLGEASSC